MGKNPLKKMVDCEYTPEFEYSSDFGCIVIHKEFEGEEGRNIEGQ